MASLNRVSLLGNLTRDVEIRYTAGGTAVCDLGLAVNERVKRGEEWVDEPVFVDVTVWGRQAETAQKFLQKGGMVAIDGKLKLETWQANDGSKRSKLKVVAENIVFCGARQGGGESESRPRSQGSRSAQQSRPVDDDIPF